jgi:sec-independent protein translocase protein TatA
MPLGIGPLELVIVLVIALVIFGPKRLPDLGKSLGTGMREFKDSITGNSKDDDDDDPTALTAAPSDDPAKPDDAVSRPRG